MRFVLAVRVFFLVLFRRDVARRVAEALQAPGPGDRAASQTSAAQPRPAPQAKAPPAAVRSEALALLATLQREARFVDFIQEPLADFSDAQIGAAAREIHRDCGKVLERLFALKPVQSEPEGAPIEVPAGFDAGRFHLTGNVTGEPPFRGRLVHHGWEAAQCQLPAWSGSPASVRVIAPAEVEV